MSKLYYGCQKRITRVGDGTFPVFGDGTPPPIAEKDWPDYDHITLEPHAWYTIHQGAQNSCCAAAGCDFVMTMREALGLERVVLAQSSVYRWDGVRIHDNGEVELIPRRRDDGMPIDVCLQILRHVGACPTEIDGKKYIDPMNWRGKGWPSDWREVAKRYQVREAWDCQNLGDLISANARGFGVIYGCDGHAVVRLGRGRDQNSWGMIHEWATEREIARQLPGYGAWALLSCIDPTDDADVPGFQGQGGSWWGKQV